MNNNTASHLNTLLPAEEPVLVSTGAWIGLTGTAERTHAISRPATATAEDDKKRKAARKDATN